MRAKTPSLAKLTRPRLFGAVARERLFRALDVRRMHPVVWVAGPPGAGKTTLVASYLDTRGLSGLWYQLDPGDGDAATFFYYLGLAASRRSTGRRDRLPVLTPEYLHDLEGFARRFFRALCERLSVPSVLVFDNYQEVPEDSVLHQLMAEAIPELPDGVTLMVLSRAAPPPAYARQVAHEAVAGLEWDELRLTLEETRAVAVTRAALTDQDVRHLHEQSGGWAAGLTLLLEGRRRSDAAGAPADQGAPDALFDYFAGQILERVPPATRRFLAAVSFLPRASAAMAEALTGDGGAGAILEDLYRRHLFTHRRSDGEVTYQFHALFHTFLRARARQLLTEVERCDLVGRAARLLEAAGQAEDAFALYREAADQDAEARLVLAQARALLAQGRGQTLRDWIGALPPGRLDEEPWLRYWLGTSLIPVDQGDARGQLTRAFERFGETGDATGQTLAACALIDTCYFQWSDFRPMSRWIGEIERLLARTPNFDTPETELHVYASLVLAMLYVQPAHAKLRACAGHVLEMLDLDLDSNQKVAAGTFLLSYCTLAIELDMGRAVVARIEPLLAGREVTPLHRLWWRTRQGHFWHYLAEYEQARRVLDEASAIAEAHGLVGLRSAGLLIESYRMDLATALRDFKAGETGLCRMRASANGKRPMDVWVLPYKMGQLAMSQGDAAAALEHAASAVELARGTGMPYVEILSLVLEAYALAEVGARERLAEISRRARALIDGTCFAHFECELTFAEAYSMLRDGQREGCRALLREALDRAKRTNSAFHCRRSARIMPAPCAEAIAAGIETDYVASVVRKYRFLPQSPDVEQWPWSVKLCTLGRFELVVDGVPVRFSGKAPRKPLTLLKALAAFGGREVPKEALLDALWPEDEADAAEKALRVTLVRLRRLLGRPDAVLVSDERVSLNPQLCWLDVWAFERLLERADGRATDGTAAAGSSDEALRMYRGAFLPGDQEEPWTVRPRERLRSRFVRHVRLAGTLLEGAGAWDRAIECYSRGLEADELAEEFYLGLMRGYRALGRPAEAIAVFRRLRHVLGVILGIAPSPASEALFRSLSREAGSDRRAV